MGEVPGILGEGVDCGERVGREEIAAFRGYDVEDAGVGRVLIHFHDEPPDLGIVFGEEDRVVAVESNLGQREGAQAREDEGGGEGEPGVIEEPPRIADDEAVRNGWPRRVGGWG